MSENLDGSINLDDFPMEVDSQTIIADAPYPSFGRVLILDYPNSHIEDNDDKKALTIAQVDIPWTFSSLMQPWISVVEIDYMISVASQRTPLGLHLGPGLEMGHGLQMW